MPTPDCLVKGPYRPGHVEDVRPEECRCSIPTSERGGTGNVVPGAAMPMLVIPGALAGGHPAPVPSLATALSTRAPFNPPLRFRMGGVGVGLPAFAFLVRGHRHASPARNTLGVYGAAAQVRY